MWTEEGRQRAIEKLPRGQNHFSAKLTEQQAIEALTSSEPASKLAERWGVDRTTIYKIRWGETWTHLKP